MLPAAIRPTDLNNSVALEPIQFDVGSAVIRPESILNTGAIGHSDSGDGGALVFMFELPGGRLFYQDTSGHWSAC